MFKFIFYCIYVLILINQNINCTKIFINSANDELVNGTNWENFPPCEYDKIIFPKVYPAVLMLPKQLAVDSLVLPRDGALLFRETSNSESLITFTNTFQKDTDKNKNCKNGNNEAKLKFPKSYNKFWFDPQNWKSSENFTKATPDLERIPCSYDTVVMPNNGIISVNFENINLLDVNGIEMGGINSTWETFQSDIYSDIAHVMFHEALDFTVKFNQISNKHDYCSCHDYNFYYDYEKRVCSHVKKLCEKNYPKCLDPIKPFNHCCEICGSILRISMDDCSSFIMEYFKNLIELEIKNMGMEEYLDYHASKIYDGSYYYVQLIIIDKNDYNELSIDFMNHLNKTILQKYYIFSTKTIFLSGMKFDKNNPGHPWKYIILPFLFTIVFFSLLYMYFVTGYIQVPNWLYQNRFGFFNSSFVFARFDNNQGEMEISENRPPIRVEGLYEAGNNDDLNSDVPRAFDNPMFDEKLEVPNSPNMENVSMASDSTELTMICLDDN